MGVLDLLLMIIFACILGNFVGWILCGVTELCEAIFYWIEMLFGDLIENIKDKFVRWKNENF